MFETLKEDFKVVFERDPAVRSVLEIIFCYPGFHAVLFHRLCPCALEARILFSRPPGFPYRAVFDRYRNPSRGQDRSRLFHRPRHGGCHRRNRRNRRQLHPLSRGDPGRHLLGQGEAPSHPGQQCRHRFRSQGSGALQGRRQQQDRLQLGGGQGGPAQLHRGRGPRSGGLCPMGRRTRREVPIWSTAACPTRRPRPSTCLFDQIRALERKVDELTEEQERLRATAWRCRAQGAGLIMRLSTKAQYAVRAMVSLNL